MPEYRFESIVDYSQTQQGHTENVRPGPKLPRTRGFLFWITPAFVALAAYTAYSWLLIEGPCGLFRSFCGR